MSLLSFLSSVWLQVFTVFGSVYALFYGLDEHLNKKGDDAVKKWLEKDASPESARRHAGKVFHLVYGDNQLSWKCLKWVIIISTLLVIISLFFVDGWNALFATSEPGLSCDHLGKDLPPSTSLQQNIDIRPPPCIPIDISGVALKTLLKYVLIVNIPIDFIAVAMTRFFIRRSGIREFAIRKVMFLMFSDTAVKIAVALAGMTALITLNRILDPELCAYPGLICFPPFMDVMAKLLFGTWPEGPIVRASFLGMLLGSLWVWTYYMSLVTVFTYRNSTLAWLKEYTSFNEYPVRNLGIPAAVGASVIAAVVVLLAKV